MMKILGSLALAGRRALEFALVSGDPVDTTPIGNGNRVAPCESREDCG